MTIYDYVLVMRQVKIAELKSRLSEHLRAVRRGDTVTVTDRTHPIARIVPFEPVDDVVVIPPAAGAPRVGLLRPPPRIRGFDSVDIVALLKKERQSHR